MSYYEEKLSDQGKKFYKRLVEGMISFEKEIKAHKSVDEKEFFRCVDAVGYEHPELFYVDFYYHTYIPNDSGWVYKPRYLYDRKTVQEKKAQIDEKVEQILQLAAEKKLQSVYQKCGWIHNYLVRNCTYDYDAIKEDEDQDKAKDKEKAVRRIGPAYTIEGVFLRKTAVCLGISLAFEYLCNKMGVDAPVGTGVALRPGCTTYEKHAWNVVRAGGEAAQVDVTWDMNVTLPGLPIRYDYFFLPDLEMMRDHQYVGLPICRQLKASYYEKTNTFFREKAELGAYIKKCLLGTEDRCKSGVYYLQYKLRNWKVPEEETKGFIKDTIRECTAKGYCYKPYVNTTQSVYLIKLEIED